MNTAPAAARVRFPSGLVQPAGSFRFSLDALLLASFSASFIPGYGKSVSLLDLGCGCGVIGLACLLERENAFALGADREPELIEAAMENATLLGLEDRYTAVRCDLGNQAERARITKEGVDIVCANMPYRPEKSGRLPRSLMRRRALFADETTVPAFLAAAKAALKPEGVFTVIYPWIGREELFAELEGYGFFMHTVLPVCTANGEKTFCLAAASLEEAHGKPPGKLSGRTLPPLMLRGEAGGAYTREALSFCRWL